MKKLREGQTISAAGQRRQQSAGRFLCCNPIGAEMDETKKALFHEDIDSSSCEKVSRRKGFARALKAVLFRSKPGMKGAENRAAGDGGCSFRFGKRSHDSESEIGLTKSSSMRSTTSSCSSSSSSSCLSSHPSESPTTSKQSSVTKQSIVRKQSSFKEQSSVKNQSIVEKEEVEEQSVKCGWSPIVIGAVLVVISLTLTVFWGRLWAIGMNAVWLCSIPKQGRMRRDLTTLTFEKKEEVETTPLRRMIVEFSSVEQRRRVIMEGLLDRKHHHHYQHCPQLMPS